MILNIVGNALKYTERGWVEVKLEVQDFDGDSSLHDIVHGNGEVCVVELTVRDSGKGAATSGR